MLRRRISPGAIACFTTREWGNLASQVAHDPAELVANRARLTAELGELAWMTEVHGTNVIVVDEPGERGDADGLVVHAPGLSPAVIMADCLPLLLANETGSVRAAVHIGRRGLVDGVVPEALRVIRELTDEQVYGVIGPSICGGCYEVSAELSEEAAVVHGAATTRWGTPSIDLAAGVRYQLDGINYSEIDLCTFESEQLFSYRRDAVTGRFAGIAVLDTP